MHTSYKSLFSALGFSFLVGLFGITAGCGGGGGSSHGSSGGGGGGDNTAIEGIATPSAVSVVTAQNADQVQ